MDPHLYQMTYVRVRSVGSSLQEVMLIVRSQHLIAKWFVDSVCVCHLSLECVAIFFIIKQCVVPTLHVCSMNKVYFHLSIIYIQLYTYIHTHTHT